jgi:hypothetical protein
MPRRKGHVPTYRLHKQSGQAIVTLPDCLGGRRDILLGRHGSKESKAEYSRVLAEWSAAGGLTPAVTTHADMTVNELLVLYVRHVEGYYRRADGTPTTEVRNIKDALRWMKAWAKLWKAWRGKEELPKVDFEKQLVLVRAVPGAINMIDLDLKLSEKGELKGDFKATEIGGPGFAYLIVVIDRAGIKSYNGKIIDKE